MDKNEGLSERGTSEFPLYQCPNHLSVLCFELPRHFLLEICLLPPWLLGRLRRQLSNDLKESGIFLMAQSKKQVGAVNNHPK